MKNKFRTKRNKPTLYAFICGHVESVNIPIDALFAYRIEMYKEAGCNVWQIRGFKVVNGSSSCERLFWETIDTTMSDAVKLYQSKIKELKGV